MYSSNRVKSNQLITFVVCLCLWLAISTSAFAQSIDPAVLTDYQTKITTVTQLEDKAKHVLQCVETQQAVISQRTNSLEITLGKLMQKQQKQQESMTVKEAQISEQKKLMATEAKKLKELKNEKNRLEAKKRQEKRDIEHCKKQWWTINKTCEWASEFGKLIGLIDNVDSDLAAANKKFNGAESRYKKTRDEFNAIKSAFTNTSREARKTNKAIDESEQAISNLKGQSSVLMEHIHSSNELIENCNETLANASAVNTDEAKRRTVRQIHRNSEQLQAIIDASPNKINQAISLLAHQGANCS